MASHEQNALRHIGQPVSGSRLMYDGKNWFELDGEGHRRYPGDYEAQVGQGAVTYHSEEAARDERSRRRHVSPAVPAGGEGGRTWRGPAQPSA